MKEVACHPGAAAVEEGPIPCRISLGELALWQLYLLYLGHHRLGRVRVVARPWGLHPCPGRSPETCSARSRCSLDCSRREAFWRRQGTGDWSCIGEVR